MRPHRSIHDAPGRDVAGYQQVRRARQGEHEHKEHQNQPDRAGAEDCHGKDLKTNAVTASTERDRNAHPIAPSPIFTTRLRTLGAAVDGVSCEGVDGVDAGGRGGAVVFEPLPR